MNTQTPREGQWSNSDLGAVDSLRSPPRAVLDTEHTWIPMRDGTRLSARIWMPEEADRTPVPAILEYIPYRKRDLKRARDTRMYPYFASHGYACVRVDLRGSGDSEGVLQDEYLPQELDDGEDILHWLDQQPWCTGDVGMIGISWGGFNGLQLAARRPAQLKAIISACSSDDRYADDVHYMGGCLLSDNLSWASTMFAYNSLPPDPRVVGECWREMWFQRLAHSGLWLDAWLRHQHRDDYWKHGSICEDYADIACPVMAVSGWADGYSNAVFRMLANLNVPRLGIIGPWSHIYPHLGTPGPAIGFLQEALRWWDQWLKGEDTGIMNEPMLRVWMQDSVEPSPLYESRPGSWVAEDNWPSPHIQGRVLPLTRGRILHPGQEPPKSPGHGRTIQSPLSVGLFAGKWCSFAAGPDMPYDQREEDGGSLVFDSDPLTESLEVLGAPVLEVELAANKPVGMLAVRMSDLRPDGKATRVTYGLLNLCQRNSREHPQPLVPGQRTHIRMQLNHLAQRFHKGHALRLSLSTSYWPLAWPPPEPVKITVYPGASRLTIPVRLDQRHEVPGPVRFEASLASPELKLTMLEPEQYEWLVTRNIGREESTLHVINDHGAYRIEEIDLKVWRKTEEWYRFRGDAFESVSGETRASWGFSRAGWDVHTETHTHLGCTKTEFVLHATLDAYEGGKRVFSQTWNDTIPRALI